MKAKRLLLWGYFFRWFFVLVLLYFYGKDMPISETSSETEPVSSGSIYGLTDEQRKKLIEKANHGDKDAAFALYQTMTRLKKNNGSKLPRKMDTRWPNTISQYVVWRKMT